MRRLSWIATSLFERLAMTAASLSKRVTLYEPPLT
jgi:hypothetical protein